MLLVIPSIEIKDGKCARTIKGVAGFPYSNDPIEIAKLWRKENAKSLHITDVDGVHMGRPVNLEIIRAMVKSVDVPIELGGGLRTFNDIERALDYGIFRVVVGTMFFENPDEVKRAIETFGANKIVFGIDVRNYRPTIKGGKVESGLTTISCVLNAKQLGIRRIVYTDIIEIGDLQRPNFEAIKLLLEKTEMRITVSGGVSNLQDLLKLQELERLGVDSVIIGRALYENNFSCQQLWRLCEAGNYPYTAKV